jgi:hypothetical protein
MRMPYDSAPVTLLKCKELRLLFLNKVGDLLTKARAVNRP